MWVWHAGRVVSVGGALCLAALLLTDETLGLDIFWRVLVPLLPLVWLVAPGLWRNLCPLAASNQTPRLLGFTRALTAPEWFRNYAPVAGIALFFAAVSSRPVLLDDSGPWTAALIVAALCLAFAGGVLLKGKSGWCSSICPLLPIQRIYGQTPYVTVPNSHCRPCVGCTRNCYDFNPRVAYLADLHDDDRHFTGHRLFFAGALPALVVAYFTTPAGLSTLDIYARFGLAIGAGAGSFFIAQSILRVPLHTLTALYGAAALNLFYWWGSPVLAATLLGDEDHPVTWVLRGLVAAATLVWLVRTLRKEKVFEEEVAGPARGAGETTRIGGDALAAIRKATVGKPEVVIEPAGIRVLAKPGESLLEVALGSDQRIESGCRMGICGADPICVVEGMENLSAPSRDENETLGRLGYAPSTRMACCAKVRGTVTIRLTPDRDGHGAGGAAPAAEDFPFDPEVRRVVVIGNGIAGLTTADHVRRRHPGCTIDVIAGEPYPLYNRMGIARLIYGRSAMVGLHLLPDAWYEEHRITMWLNTRADRVDRETREVHLATGETVAYDRLVLATGSAAFVPPIEGYGLPGTHVLRSADDALAIRRFVQLHKARTAAVTGGGLLGLEAAFALSKVGLAVTVLERGEWLLNRQIDPRASQLLQLYLEGLGLTIMLGAEAVAVEGDGHLEQVLLRDGGMVPADVVLVAAGISPSVELARDAGLEVRRGVVVDDRLRTSDPHVYAVGDAAEFEGNVLGLWPAGAEQAEVAAENVAGGDRAYTPTVPVTMLKVVGIDLLTCGRFRPLHDDEEPIVVEEPDRHAYAKLLVGDGRLIGAVLLGHPALGGPVSAAVKEGRDVTGLLDRLREGDLGCLAQDAEARV